MLMMALMGRRMACQRDSFSRSLSSIERPFPSATKERTVFWHTTVGSPNLVFQCVDGFEESSGKESDCLGES